MRLPATFAAILFSVSLTQATADDIRLGDFPRGKWLDAQWKAYWTFVDDDIRLLDVRDEPIFEFKGIVQNMRIERAELGLALTFDCAQARRSYRFVKPDTGANLLMEIRQWSELAPYAVDMPSITDTELVTYKRIVIEAETAAPETESAPKANAGMTVASLLRAAETADFARLEELSLAALADGTADAIIADLEAQAKNPDCPPSVHIALSMMYGRKSMRTMEYAAMERAIASVRPGVAINVAAFYGRKSLIASRPDADSFMIGDIEIAPEPGTAEVFVNGERRAPGLIRGVRAGTVKILVSAKGFQDLPLTVTLDVGKTVSVRPTLIAIEQPEYTPIPPAPSILSAAEARTGIEALLRERPDGYAMSVRELSPLLPKSEREAIFGAVKSDGLGFFLLNFIVLPISVGSLVQGDMEAFWIASGFKSGAMIGILGMGALGLLESPNDPITIGAIVTCGVAFWFGQIFGYITPWTYAERRNAELKNMLRIDVAASLEPFLDLALNERDLSMRLGVTLRY